MVPGMSFEHPNSTGGFELIFRPPFSFDKLKNMASGQIAREPEYRIPPILNINGIYVYLRK